MNVKLTGKLRITIVSLIFFLFCFQASAQRYLPGSIFIRGELSTSFSTLNGFGGYFDCGQHLYNSFWTAGLGMENRGAKLSNDGRMDYTHFYVSGEWAYMVWATRTRNMAVHLGAGAFVGYEAYDTFNRLPSYYRFKSENSNSTLGNGAFLYGIYPAAEYSIYVHPGLSVYGRFTLPIQFAAPTGWVKYHLGVGLRYEFQ